VPFTLATYIQQVRNRHPAFDKRLVPDKVLADFASLDQRDILTMALSRDRQYLAQSLAIGFDLDNAALDAPGTAGVGTAGGVPAEPDRNGGFRLVQATTGSGVQVDTTEVVTLVDETPVQGATSNTLTGAGVSWATNAYANDVVVITAGLGAGQPPRTIQSNTSGQLTLTSAWAIIPDGTSLFQVVQAVTALDDQFGVVTDLPSTTQQTGYLVRLNAQGVPYIDTTKPLVVSIARGVPLPPYHSVLRGTVRMLPQAGETTGCTYPLTLQSYSARGAVGSFAAYLFNGTLRLLGGRCDWDNVQGIELDYVPIPPDFTARTDVFLLPDTALPVAVARAAFFAATRLQGLPDVPPVPLDTFALQATSATNAFMNTLLLTKTARVSRMRRGRY